MFASIDRSFLLGTDDDEAAFSASQCLGTITGILDVSERVSGGWLEVEEYVGVLVGGRDGGREGTAQLQS